MKKLIIVLVTALCLGLTGISFAGEAENLIIRNEEVQILIKHYQNQKQGMQQMFPVVIKTLDSLEQEKQAINQRLNELKAAKEGKKKK